MATTSSTEPTVSRIEGEEDDDSRPAADDEDTGAQVAPIVQLQEVAVSTGEENEDVLLELKSKLYRFVKEGNQWKERGVGVVKLLKHKETGKVRLVMRQNKTLKICANHLVLPTMSVQEHHGNDKSCVWHAADFADGELKDETFCIRFASVEREIFEEEKVEEEEVEVEEEEVEVEVEKVEVEEEVEVEEVKEESVEKVHKWLFKEEEDMTWETYRYCSNWNTIERSILMKTIHNFAKANCPKDYWKVRTWMNLSDTYNEMAVRSNQIKRSYHEIIGGGKYLQSVFTIERQRHFHENTPVDQILLDIFEPCNECRNRIPVFPKSLLYNGSTPSTSFGSRTDSSSHSKKQWTPDELELLKSTISDFSSASMPKPYWDVQLWTYLSETYNVQARFKNLNTVSYLEFIRGGMQLQSIFCEERLSNALHGFGSCGRDFVLMKIFEPCLECRKRIPVFPNGLPNNGFTSLASSSARSVQSHFTSYEDESYSATLNNMLIVVREMFEKGLLTSAQLSIVTFKLQDFAQSETWKMCLLNNIFTLEMKREVLIQMCPEA